MLPQFLGIGAQKAGTTWLYENVKRHPDAWMSPVKEIFYFDRPTRMPLLLQLCNPKAGSLRQHTFGGVHKRVERLKRPPEAVPDAPTPAPQQPARAPIPTGPHPGRLETLRWYAHFMLLPRGDRWYRSVFRPAPGQIAGDINPYLANLPRESVAHVHRLMPDAKLVYLIRNPIDRLWSHLGMAIRERKLSGLEAIEPDVLKQSLVAGSQSPLSDYLGNLATWRAFYPEEQIFVGFFDQLVTDPATLLKNIYGFIGLRADDELIPPSVRKKRNPGSGRDIPQDSARQLAELFLPQLERLHEHFSNSYTESWLTAARQSLQPGDADSATMTPR